MGTAPRPQRKATYVAPRPDGDWLLSEQRKLYTRSEEESRPPRYAIHHGEPGA